MYALLKLDKRPDRSDTMSMKLTAAYKKVGDWWAASIEEIPGVHTQGSTYEEARENLKDALQMVLEVNRELAEKENGAAQREEFVVA
jgi:predicted RNase H-like HicB family nuclease